MAPPRPGAPWTPRPAPASSCTPASHRASGASPSYTARTATTTCRPKPCPATPPSPASRECPEPCPPESCPPQPCPTAPLSPATLESCPPSPPLLPPRALPHSPHWSPASQLFPSPAAVQWQEAPPQFVNEATTLVHPQHRPQRWSPAPSTATWCSARHSWYSPGTEAPTALSSLASPPSTEPALAQSPTPASSSLAQPPWHRGPPGTASLVQPPLQGPPSPDRPPARA